MTCGKEGIKVADEIRVPNQLKRVSRIIQVSPMYSPRGLQVKEGAKRSSGQSDTV
jgi:hypothetical protein